MVKINAKILSKIAAIVILSGLVCLLVVTSGCSTASWIIHHNGTADDLTITEADVDAMIDELLSAQPENPETVLYNKTTDRYELTPDAFRKAIRDGIIRRIQDKKIGEFLENYHFESFTDALRKDFGTGGCVILLIGILGGLFY